MARKSLPWELPSGKTYGPVSARPAWVHEGDGVSAIQRGLGIEESGTYDEATRRAVVAYQREKNLSVTGTVDRRLFARLTRGQG